MRATIYISEIITRMDIITFFAVRGANVTFV